MGGGVSRDEVDSIWLYQYTTSNPAARDRNVLVPGAGGLESHHHPMHGLGYGLPLSRVYARYFQVSSLVKRKQLLLVSIARVISSWYQCMVWAPMCFAI